MKNRLLKEYIELLVQKYMLEAGTTGTVGSMSLRSSVSTTSTNRSTGSTSSESTLGTGSSADKQEQSDKEDAISNIEDAVTANSQTIANNQKAINNAAHKMALQTNNMISSTKKTASGLNTASNISRDLGKKQTDTERTNNYNRQSDAIKDAASGVADTSTELNKTLTTLQGLEGATKSST